MPRTHSFLPAVLVCVIAGNAVASGALAPPASAQRGAAGNFATNGADVVRESRFAAVPTAAEWRDLVARDARLSFTSRTAGEARSVLESPDSTSERRAIALIALGGAGAVVERARLERTIQDGNSLERRAAVLALGEMGAGSDGQFVQWMANTDDAFAECALLAMLRTQRGAARRRVEELAADPAQRLARVAEDALVFTADPGSSKPTRSAALLLNLRFEAARLHGLVDGENWEGARIRALAENRDLARDIVLSYAPALHTPAVRDHVFTILLAETGRARLHAAVRLMPGELSDLVENGLWSPRDDRDWADMLDVIDSERLERLTLPIVRAALEVRSVRYKASVLTSLAGDEDMTPLIGLDPTTITPEERALVCLAIGARTDPGWLERFSILAEDKSALVRMAYLVARFRQGSKKAAEEVNAILLDDNASEHKELITALCDAVHDTAVGVLLEARFLDAPPDEKTTIAVSLCLEGRLIGRTQVRAALATEPPPTGPTARRLVRALRRDATAEDIGVLRDLFPSVAQDPDMDRELALALLNRGEAEVTPILRAALWRDDLEISILAGGAMANVIGVRALVEELREPPAGASSGDVRRVGFAIGVFGGVDAVRSLARDLRWSSGNPALQGALLGALSTRTQ